MIYKKTNEWYNESQWMTTSGTRNGNEWQRVVQRMTASDNEWQPVIKNDSELQQMAESDTTNEKNESKKNRVILSFKMKQNVNLVPKKFYSTFHAIYNSYTFQQYR